MSTTQDRLRQAARFTRLDADRELLTEAADALDRREAVIRLLEGEVAATTQPAEVTRDEVMQAAKKATAPEWQDVIDGWHMGLDLMAFARAILALCPVQVPMTDEQVDAFTVNGRLHWLGKRQLIRGVEAYYGITAQAKKETP